MSRRAKRPPGRHIRPPSARHSARPVASMPSKNARDSRTFQLTSSVSPRSVMRPPGTSRPMPSSGSIAADSRASRAPRQQRADARVAVPRSRAPSRRAARGAGATGPPAPRAACHSHSLAGRRAGVLAGRTRARSASAVVGTRAVAVIVGPVDGSSTRSAPRTKNSRSPLLEKPVPSRGLSRGSSAGWQQQARAAERAGGEHDRARADLALGLVGRVEQVGGWPSFAARCWR